MSYIIVHEIPSVETYCRLRLAAGLSAKSRSASAIGLPNSVFAVQIMYHPPADEGSSDTHGPFPVGMGRVIGDGALFFQVVDIAVLPDHQGKGLGNMILKEIESWIEGNVPPTGYISLIADGQAKELYAKYGFGEIALTGSVAMARPIVKEIDV